MPRISHENEPLDFGSLDPQDVICQIDLVTRKVIEEFATVTLAAANLKRPSYQKHARTRIRDCLTQRRSQAWGFTWILKSKLPSDLSELAKRDTLSTKLTRGSFDCPTCKKHVLVSESHMGLAMKCHSCKASRKAEWRQTINGRLTSLVNAARNRVRKSGAQRGWSTEVVTVEQLTDKLHSQKFRCFYSGILLSFKSSAWQVSLERLDDKQGYSNSNTALICLEFNVAAKWTRTKLSSIQHERQTTLDQDELTKAILAAIRGMHHRPKHVLHGVHERNQNGRFERLCPWCDHWWSFDQFSKGRRECKSCARRQRCQLGHFLMHLLKSAKSNTRGLENDLTMCDLIELIIYCYYSGIPLRFSSYVDWRCSLERLDVSLGYTRSNCVLICWEFNSGVFNSGESTTQWSKEKFRYWLQTLNERGGEGSNESAQVARVSIKRDNHASLEEEASPSKKPRITEPDNIA
jgi:hypothetical protein